MNYLKKIQIVLFSFQNKKKGEERVYLLHRDVFMVNRIMKAKIMINYSFNLLEDENFLFDQKKEKELRRRKGKHVMPLRFMILVDVKE